MKVAERFKAVLGRQHFLFVYTYIKSDKGGFDCQFAAPEVDVVAEHRADDKYVRFICQKADILFNNYVNCSLPPLTDRLSLRPLQYSQSAKEIDR